MKMVQEMGRNWRDIVNKNFPNRTPLSAKNRYGLLQRRQDNSVEYGSSPDRGASFNTGPHTPSTATSRSGLHPVPTPTRDISVVSDVQSGTQLPPIHHPFSFDLSRNITPVSIDTQDISANPAVLNGPSFWPLDVTATNSELPRRFLDMPTQIDTMVDGSEMENAPTRVGSQPNKVLHVTVSCNSSRLEEVMHNISKNMSELMVTGGVQRVQYSVE